MQNARNEYSNIACEKVDEHIKKIEKKLDFI
jgi:hypothetical protein